MKIKTYWFSFSELRHSFTGVDDLYKIYSLLKTSLTQCEDEVNDTDYFDKLCQAFGFNFDDLKGTIASEEYRPSDSPIARLMATLTLKYDNHFIAHDDNDNKFIASPSVEVYNVFKRLNLLEFCKGFMSILFTTYSKYNSILTMYDNYIASAMDSLKKESSMSKEDDYTTESKGSTLHNDTPQDSDIVATIEGNQYVSDLSKSSGEVTNSGTSSYSTEESFDTKYPMEKLQEVQESYQKVVDNWANEFRGIFIEENNL